MSAGTPSGTAARLAPALVPPGERGSVTAEFAAALPAVLLCLALCLAAVQAGAQQAQLVGAASHAARMLGRGDPPPAPSGGPAASSAIEKEGGMVCVRLTAPTAVTGLSLLGVTVAARACALDETDLE